MSSTRLFLLLLSSTVAICALNWRMSMRPEASVLLEGAGGLSLLPVSVLSEKRTLFSLRAPVRSLFGSSWASGILAGALVITSSSPPAWAAVPKRLATAARPPARRAARGDGPVPDPLLRAPPPSARLDLGGAPPRQAA